MNKITAIEKTIYNLENDVYPYEWSICDQCNCGVLARTILGGRTANSCGLADSPSVRGIGAFSKHTHCLTTNLPLPEVFQKLKEAGFSYQELCDLEFLSDEKIAAKANIRVDGNILDQKTSHVFDQKKYLIAYLKSWLQILKEQTLQQPENSKYVDITPSLAVLPTEETSDIILGKVKTEV